MDSGWFNLCFFVLFFSIQFQRTSAFSSVEFWIVLIFFFFIISLLFTFVGLVTNIVMKDYAGGNIVLKFKFDKNQIDICHIEKYRSKFK